MHLGFYAKSQYIYFLIKNQTLKQKQMSVKIKTKGWFVIGLILFAGLFAVKAFVWDKIPHSVEESKTFGKVSIPDVVDPSLSGSAAVKFPLPSKKVTGAGTNKINWYIMAWQSQNSIAYANGGKQTTEGSLFAKNDFDVSLIRQDDCGQSVTELVKFSKEYKSNPNTPAVFITFMGSGIPAYISNLSNLVKDLGPDYQPVAFLSTGKSFGEDQLVGDIKYKTDKQNLKGAVVIGVRMDGDNDLALKLAGDNNIKINSDETTYDPDALNFVYPKDFLDAVVKYNAGYSETRKIVKAGKTTGKDTSISPTIVATWTPGDVNAHNGKGGVTIISTKEYASIMPNITITCKKWLNDHRAAAENLLMATAIAGDQIRTFDEAKKYAASLNVEIYGEQTAKYWADYFDGVVVDQNTHLGGSRVFNLADMANLFGLSDNNHVDIYKAVYNTFGTLQSKYYTKDLPSYLDYNKAIDKSILMSVISNHPELLEGKANLVDYSKTDMTSAIGNKAYHNIEFDLGSAQVKPSSYATLDQIFSDVTSSDGTKIQISGHTDNTGDQDKNVTLSEQRAQAVVEYLKKKGLKAERFAESQGFGSSKPVADNSTAAGRASNRRVEIKSFGQ